MAYVLVDRAGRRNSSVDPGQAAVAAFDQVHSRSSETRPFPPVTLTKDFGPLLSSPAVTASGGALVDRALSGSPKSRTTA